MTAFVKPETHLARNAEERTPEEMARLEALDAVVASFDLDLDDLDRLLFVIRRAYRVPLASYSWSTRAATFLDDLARAIDDAAIDRRNREAVEVVTA